MKNFLTISSSLNTQGAWRVRQKKQEGKNTKKQKEKVAKTTVEAKGKSAAAAATPATKAPSAVNVRRERMELKTKFLKPAPWNPRGEISPESVADLVSSISAVGMIEPVVVMAAADGKGYVIIAGHRRVKAAELAKVEAIPCDVLIGIDTATAKRMTFIENLQRRDADPILESNLVAELVADGMTTDEIAAEIGRDRKWVLRRKNLSNLSPSWRKRVEKGEKITTDCLEHIAAYPADVQEKFKKEYLHHNSALRWHDIDRFFNHESQNLCEAPFDTTPCSTCSNNTGCAPDLFDWAGKPVKLGQCLCKTCYKKKYAAHIDAIVKQAESDGALVLRREPSYEVNTSPTRTKKCSVLYVYRPCYSDETRVKWGEPPKKRSGTKVSAKEQEKALAEKRERRERNKAIRALATWCATDGNLAKLIVEFFKDPVTGDTLPYAPFYIQAAFVGIDSYHLLGSQTDKTKGGISAIFGHLRIPAGWASIVAKQIVSYLDPGRSQGYYAYPNSRLVLAMFPSIRTELGEDVAEKILPKDDVDALKNPKISWDKSSKTPDDPLGSEEELPE